MRPLGSLGPRRNHAEADHRHHRTRPRRIGAWTRPSPGWIHHRRDRRPPPGQRPQPGRGIGRKRLSEPGNDPGPGRPDDPDLPLRDQLMQLARDLHGHPFDLSGIDLALYHAAAVFAANYPTTLLAEAITLAVEAGLPAETARQGMTTLLAGAVNNLRNLAPADAITGPASRGDQGTIERHLEALKRDPELQRLYRLLADRTKLLSANKEAAA